MVIDFEKMFQASLETIQGLQHIMNIMHHIIVLEPT